MWLDKYRDQIKRKEAETRELANLREEGLKIEQKKAKGRCDFWFRRLSEIKELTVNRIEYLIYIYKGYRLVVTIGFGFHETAPGEFTSNDKMRCVNYWGDSQDSEFTEEALANYLIEELNR